MFVRTCLHVCVIMKLQSSPVGFWCFKCSVMIGHVVFDSLPFNSVARLAMSLKETWAICPMPICSWFSWYCAAWTCSWAWGTAANGLVCCMHFRRKANKHMSTKHLWFASVFEKCCLRREPLVHIGLALWGYTCFCQHVVCSSHGGCWHEMEPIHSMLCMERDWTSSSADALHMVCCQASMASHHYIDMPSGTIEAWNIVQWLHHHACACKPRGFPQWSMHAWNIAWTAASVRM